MIVFLTPPKRTESVKGVGALTGLRVTLKLAVLAPVAIGTLEGAEAASVLFHESGTEVPGAAGPFSVMKPSTEPTW